MISRSVLCSLTPKCHVAGSETQFYRCMVHGIGRYCAPSPKPGYIEGVVLQINKTVILLYRRLQYECGLCGS